ncbi:porin family protein [Dysgonomonas sp. 25]|uniref:porin family protein n=1 Tax=Dysgonomonas sp. 25 TaxID=2302933 RepID=UPI0013D39E1F|nr:porin family protein [Dysgonomonas sp. 25]NDV67335.1 PorT family protein [Dysgonomonas sp. 25]
MKAIYKIIILVSLLSLSIGATAQIGAKKKFFLDFRIGANSSEMDIKDQNYGKKVKPGYHFAVVGAYKFYDNIQFQSGIHVTKKGMKRRTVEPFEDLGGTYREVKAITTTTDANYIMMPLMLGWESDYNKTWLFNVNAGVYGAWGFSGETKERGTQTIYFAGESSVDKYSEKYDTFTSENLKKTDYGLIGSVGVVYDIYTLNLTYEYGLYNISQKSDIELRNRNLTLSIGFRF